MGLISQDFWHGKAREHGFSDAHSMLVLLHLGYSYSLCSIATLVGCSRWTIARLMHELDVPVRKHVGKPLSDMERECLKSERNVGKVPRSGLGMGSCSYRREIVS
jgi:hypothetical protein